MKMLNLVTSGKPKMRWGLALRAMFKYMACRDGLLSVSRAILFSAGGKFAKIRVYFFAEILDILGHSSESNRWIWLRLGQDGVKVLKNVLPEAQLLENSVAKVMHALRSGS